MYLFVFAKHPELGYQKKALFILLKIGGVVSCYSARKRNIVERMVVLMEKNLRHLEATVDERTADLEAEKWKTESLLLKMLPRFVRDDWVRKRCAKACT